MAVDIFRIHDGIPIITTSEHTSGIVEHTTSTADSSSWIPLLPLSDLLDIGDIDATQRTVEDEILNLDISL